MLWLPYPIHSGNPVPIAVAERSAAALERAILEDDRALGANAIERAMRADAWFCKWIDGWVPGSHATIGELSKWFAANANSLLTNPLPRLLSQRGVRGEGAAAATPISNWCRPDHDEAERLAKSAAAARASAIRAAETVGEAKNLTESRAFLAAMLQVAQAASDEGASEEAEPAEDYLAIADGIEWRLPRLISRLAKLAKLEADFDALLEQSKLDAMKELAYGASHEVNNPLANISGRAQAMLRDETEPRRRRLLAAIDSQAMRAHEMISDLMLFARPPALEKQPMDVGQIVKQVIDEFTDDAADRQIAFEYEQPAEEIIATIDPTQMAVAMNALLRNAIEAVGNGGRVITTLERTTDDSDGTILQFKVADTGPGIDEQVRQHLFDPFYSGREAGRGLGFGLSKCWRIVTDHGGTIDVQSASELGAVFVLRFPAGDDASPTGEEG